MIVMHRRGTSVAKLVVVLWVLIGLGGAAQDESCSTSRLADDIYNDVINSIAFDTESLKWTATPGPGAARVRLDSSAKMREVLGPLLRNRRLLFLGDSTARNPAMVLMTMMCNDHFDQCYQLLRWEKDPMESISCDSGVPGNDYTCASDVSVWEVPIAGITTNVTPSSRAARKAMWAKGEVPPLARIRSRRLNVTIDILEAGCGRGDSMVEVLYKFMNSTNATLQLEPRILYGHDTSGDSERSSIRLDGRRATAGYDAVVIGGGMHCNYRRFRSGWWYKTLVNLLRYVAPRTPVVFLEMPHCLKVPQSGPVTDRMLVHCPFLSRVVDDMKSVFLSAPGVFVAPTRNFTANLSLMQTPGKRLTRADREAACPFTDMIHPSLACYVSIATSAVLTVHRALRGMRGAALDAACFVDRPWPTLLGVASSRSPSRSLPAPVRMNWVNHTTLPAMRLSSQSPNAAMSVRPPDPVTAPPLETTRSANGTNTATDTDRVGAAEQLRLQERPSHGQHGLDGVAIFVMTTLVFVTVVYGRRLFTTL